MAKSYFKATRSDAMDFATGTILYEVGKTVRPEPAAMPRICGPGYLHASDVEAETLIGGSWPCRLFEVCGTPKVGFNSEHRHKGGFTQLKVVRELDPYLALGPNGRYVAAIIERSRKLTATELDELAASRAASWAASRAASWAASRAASRDASWAASRAASWDASRAASWDASRAAIAYHSKDLITPEQFDLLIGPWRSVVGNTRPIRRKGL